MSLLNSISGFGNANSMREFQRASMDPSQGLAKQGLEKIEAKSEEIAAKGFEKNLQGQSALKEQYYEATELPGISSRSNPSSSISSLAEGLLESVDAKAKASKNEVRKLITGESDNLHQAMISMQESGVAFNLLVEVRNKMVESYKELTRMAQ